MHNALYAHLPEPFCYYRAILKSDHLHFGLWQEDETTTSMEDAQENMFNYLVSFFPPPPAEVLDVGCGLGLSAYLLSRKGYKVTAIAPSPEIINYAQQKYGEDGIKFEVLGFFDEDEVVFAQEKYDVLFFQESAQYVSPIDDVMKKARRLLKENGFLIIGDEVCYDESIKPETAVHLSKDFTIALEERGFRVTENKKIGKSVFPTYDFVIRGFTENNERIIAECCEKDTAERLNFYLNGWRKQKDWNLQGKTGYEVFVAKKDSFSIAPYSAGDESKILAAFNEVFGVRRTLEHWYWEFRDNPYGSYKISEVYSRDGKLVAQYAGYPVPFYIEVDSTPTVFISFQIGDTMTRPEVRNIGRGKTSLLSRTARHFYAKYCEGIAPFTYGFNTGTIKKFGERFLGYQYIDPVPYRIKKVKISPVLGSSLFKKIFSKYTGRTTNFFDETFDRLLEKTASSYKFLAKRESQYLTWRYRDCPDKDYIMISVYRGVRLVGWSVFLKKDTRLIWGDALFDREDPGAVEFLLNYVLAKALCKDIETIEGWFSRNPLWWNKMLDQLGFEVTNEPNNLFPCFFILSDNGWLEKLQNCFYYTMGDSDLF